MREAFRLYDEVFIPDGTEGVVLSGLIPTRLDYHLPSGRDAERVEAYPVLLPSGAVRFFAGDDLTLRDPERVRPWSIDNGSH